jgi:hypothetical protein
LLSCCWTREWGTSSLYILLRFLVGTLASCMWYSKAPIWCSVRISRIFSTTSGGVLWGWRYATGLLRSNPAPPAFSYFCFHL